MQPPRYVVVAGVALVALLLLADAGALHGDAVRKLHRKRGRARTGDDVKHFTKYDSPGIGLEVEYSRAVTNVLFLGSIVRPRLPAAKQSFSATDPRYKVGSFPLLDVTADLQSSPHGSTIEVITGPVPTTEEDSNGAQVALTALASILNKACEKESDAVSLGDSGKGIAFTKIITEYNAKVGDSSKFRLSVPADGKTKKESFNPYLECPSSSSTISQGMQVNYGAPVSVLVDSDEFVNMLCAMKDVVVGSRAFAKEFIDSDDILKTAKDDKALQAVFVLFAWISGAHARNDVYFHYHGSQLKNVFEHLPKASVAGLVRAIPEPGTRATLFRWMKTWIADGEKKKAIAAKMVSFMCPEKPDEECTRVMLKKWPNGRETLTAKVLGGLEEAFKSRTSEYHYDDALAESDTKYGFGPSSSSAGGYAAYDAAAYPVFVVNGKPSIVFEIRNPSSGNGEDMKPNADGTPKTLRDLSFVNTVRAMHGLPALTSKPVAGTATPSGPPPPPPVLQCKVLKPNVPPPPPEKPKNTNDLSPSELSEHATKVKEDEHTAEQGGKKGF